jgi:predicted permease
MNTAFFAIVDANQKAMLLGIPLAALFITAIIIVAIWDGVWKMIALWKSARNDQLGWFICLAIFNTAGILPIIYILWFQKTAPPRA